MDEITFRQLKESKYYQPVLTEVMFDQNMMLEMAAHSMTIIEKGYDAVWDSNLLKFSYRYFREGIKLVGNLIREKGIYVRLIVEATKENIDFIESINLHEIRCLDNLNGNFGIFDNRAYMVQIFHTKGDKIDQTLWSNSKVLVDKQQSLFDRLWSMAVPISIRKKELEYEDESITHRTITEYDNIVSEIESFIQTSKQELIIFSSNKLLNGIQNKHNLIKYFPSLLERDTTIKILIDNMDETMIEQITSLNKFNQENPVQLGYTNEIGELNEMIIISDNKRLLNAGYNQDNNLIATFSKEEHNILVQELMFEKYWNEVKSLETLNQTSK